MAGTAYCKKCGTGTRADIVNCPTCGCRVEEVKQNPLYSKVSNTIKAVIFDIDDTILDPSQRFKDARRAGLVDEKGAAVIKKLMSKGKAWKKRNTFLYSMKNLNKDQPIPGAKKSVYDLSEKGFTIIYVTGRPSTTLEKTIVQLESNNFPLFKGPTGETLVYAVGGGKPAKEKKGDKIRELMGRYDVQMVFDDDFDVLEKAKELGIPGIYPSVRQYTDVKSNPQERFGYFSTEEDAEEAYASMPDPDDEDGRSVEEVLSNPLIKPRRKKTKSGYRKEPRKKYIDRFMSDSKIKKEFPNRDQRYAVAMTYVEKYYDVKTNPANKSKIEKGKKEFEKFHEKQVNKITTEKIDIGDVWYSLGPCWEVGYRSGKDDNSEDQKFQHIFGLDEDTGEVKKEPILYATMPDKGEQLLIIKGGDWKIEDRDGVSWLVW